MMASRCEGMESLPIFPAPDHDHDLCRRTMMHQAEQVCARRGARLTKHRRRVLEILSRDHKALGAYEILQQMTDEGRRATPTLVYRALDFLMAHGLARRLATCNAFVACARHAEEAAHADGGHFLICQSCGAVAELDPAAAGIDSAIRHSARAFDFEVRTPVVEVSGICRHCHAAAAAS